MSLPPRVSASGIFRRAVMAPGTFVGVGRIGTAVGGTMVGTKIGSGFAVAVGVLGAWRTVTGARRVNG